MYLIKEYELSNEDKILRKIINVSLENLKNNFKKINLAYIEVNNLRKDLYNIEKDVNLKRKNKKIKIFLNSYASIYNKSEKTPLNSFAKECKTIIKEFTI